MSITQVRIKVGLDLPTSDRTGLGWSEFRGIAMLAEDVGFDSIWLDDHLLYHMRGAAEPNGNWESWSMLSALAAKKMKTRQERAACHIVRYLAELDEADRSERVVPEAKTRDL